MYVCVCLKHKGELGWRAGTVCTPVIQHLGRWKLKGQRLKAGLVAQGMDKALAAHSHTSMKPGVWLPSTRIQSVQVWWLS